MMVIEKDNLIGNETGMRDRVRGGDVIMLEMQERCTNQKGTTMPITTVRCDRGNELEGQSWPVM